MRTDVFNIDNFKIKILVNSEKVPYPTVPNSWLRFTSSCKNKQAHLFMPLINEKIIHVCQRIALTNYIQEKCIPNR